MISTLPPGAHIPKLVALKCLDTLTGIRNKGFEPKGLIHRLGWGYLTIYKSSLGTRKLGLSGNDPNIFCNGIIYRHHAQLVTADWYIFKSWYQMDDGGLRLHTYAVGDTGNNDATLVDLNEV